MSDRIKPCPFCGRTKINVREYGTGWKAQCTGTICLANLYYSPTREAAIAAWNRRTDPAKDALVAALKEIAAMPPHSMRDKTIEIARAALSGVEE